MKGNFEEMFFTRSRKNNLFLHRKPSTNFVSPNVLPRVLYVALSVFGIKLKEDKNSGCDRKGFCKKYITSSNIKLVIAHLSLFFHIAEKLISRDRITFFLSGELEMFCYVLGLDLFLFRKKKIMHCLEQLMEMPSSNLYPSNIKKQEDTSVILSTAFLYASLYLTYGYFALAYLEVGAPQHVLIVVLVSFTIYCFLVYVGLPIHIALFIQFALQIYDKLLYMDQSLKSLSKEQKFTPNEIRSLRTTYCKLQKVCSSVDEIFNELVLMWLIKIIFRVCLSTYDVLTEPWTDSNATGQVFVLLDIIFDIALLLLLCSYAGKVDYGKSRMLESLIFMCTKNASHDENVRQEIHFLVSLVGHSRIDFTIARIFILSKSIAITILGALGSASVIIYQLTSA